jgi:hypothetical protein
MDHSKVFQFPSLLRCTPFLAFQVNQQYVSVFLTAGNIKYLLLHSGKGEIEIKNFFHEVHDLYVKVNLRVDDWFPIVSTKRLFFSLFSDCFNA